MPPSSPWKEERDPRDPDGSPPRDPDGSPPRDPEGTPARSVVATRVSVPSSGLPEGSPSACVSATHTILFEPDVPRCDVCDNFLTAEETSDDSFEVAGGHGLYVWVRHGTVVYEEPPLCTSCGAAITMTALQRWFMEEEEG